MPGASKPLSCLVLGLLLTACASPPEPKPPTETEVVVNPAIQEAEDDLQHARIQRSEWMVIESAISSHPVSLGEILDLARKKQRNGDQTGATLLAQKVSRFARLGIDQALQQANAKPFYPQ